MSDPLDRLRKTRDAATPDVDAIRSRARRIERRRYAAVGGGAVAIVLIAIVGVVLGAGPDRGPARQLAESRDSEATASPVASKAAEKRASGAAASRVAPAGGALTSGATAASPQPAAAPGAESAFAAEDRSGAAELTLTLTVDERVGGADFTLRVCNETSKSIEKSFASAQRYDFEVSRDGERVWRWSDSQLFAQVTGQESWSPGQCRFYSESWDGRTSAGAPASPGQYQAVGILSSSPPLRSSAKSFCLGAC